MSPVKHFGITAATFSGNRGAEAMLLSTIENLRKRYPSCAVHVLSYSPKADLAELNKRPIPDVFIHSSTPKTLVLSWFLGSLLATIFTFLRLSPVKRHNQNILRLLKLDAVFDLAGVSFIDGREKFLPFNVLTLWPFVLHGVPVFKMAQAMGPISSLPNRIAAWLILPQMSYTFARGDLTAQFLRDFELNPKIWEKSPDIAFGLSTREPEKKFEAKDVALVPSVILDRKHPQYRQLLIDCICQLAAQGTSSSLIAHSWKSQTDKPFNNDLPLCKDLAKACELRGVKIQVLGENCDAREIKHIIAQHKICFTSRFHGMIASLDSAMPTLVLGWSHKYREILALFKREEWALKFAETSPELCVQKIQTLLGQLPAEKLVIQEQLGSIRNQVTAAFEKTLNILEPR